MGTDGQKENISDDKPTSGLHAAPTFWHPTPTRLDFDQHDGLFTLPDGSGGSMEDLEEYWAVDSCSEMRVQSYELLERTAYAVQRPELGRYRGLGLSAKILAHNVRAIDAGLVGDLTDEQWENIVGAFGRQCAYCGADDSDVIEHVVPISRGGGTTVENVVPACARCNARKHAKTPQEWLSPVLFEVFHERHQAALAEVKL